MNERNLNAIPATACQFGGGEVALGDAGDSAKTSPVRIKARSGQPLEHWFWGRVVHDLAGMRLHKPRLPIDYAHNDAEVLGYLNHFDASTGDLMASGALIPFKDGDRASEVLFKMREGVPYEASIFFGGDGIKVQEIADGEITPVNGYDFAGPGVVIREWPLRGVAVCPYGADANTESAALAGGQTFTATKWSASSEEKAMEANQAEQAVDAKTETEASAVEVTVVEAEAATQQADTAAPVNPEAEITARVDALTARIGAADEEVKRLSGENAALVKRAETAEAALVEATAARDELATRANDAETKLAEATASLEAVRVKLAAIEAGAPPVSAVPGETKDGPGDAWKKAVAAGRKESK